MYIKKLEKFDAFQIFRGAQKIVFYSNIKITLDDKALEIRNRNNPNSRLIEIYSFLRVMRESNKFYNFV